MGGMSAKVVFVPTVSPSDFHRIIAASDVLLDPYPFGGGVTTLEAFGACKAVVTFPGAQNVPQLTAGMYGMMGGEAESILVAGSVEEYVATAVRLGGDKAERERVEKLVCEGRGSVYDDDEVVREFEGIVKRAVGV